MLYDGDSQKAITQVGHEISAIYSRDRVSTQFSNITLDMFTDPSNPLAATALLSGKAAECRHLAPCLLEIWTAHKRATDFDGHVELMLKFLCDMYAKLDHRDALNRIPVYFSPAASGEFRNDLDSFLTHYMFLRSIAEANDWPIFHAVSKFHSFWHLGFESQFVHPAIARAYTNEDYVGQKATDGLTVRPAIPAPQRATAVTEKLALGKCLDLFFSEPDH
jgi:hypothetical protein